MNVTSPCSGCGRWLAPNLTEICVDCTEQYCHSCAVATHHRTVHEDATPDQQMPEGWTYLRCKDTPYSIHSEGER